MWFLGHSCKMSCVKAIVNAGAELNYVNEDEMTALDIAANPPCNALVRDFLIGKGAKTISTLLSSHWHGDSYDL